MLVAGPGGFAHPLFPLTLQEPLFDKFEELQSWTTELQSFSCQHLKHVYFVTVTNHLQQSEQSVVLLKVWLWASGTDEDPIVVGSMPLRVPHTRVLVEAACISRFHGTLIFTDTNDPSQLHCLWWWFHKSSRGWLAKQWKSYSLG